MFIVVNFTEQLRYAFYFVKRFFINLADTLARNTINFAKILQCHFFYQKLLQYLIFFFRKYFSGHFNVESIGAFYTIFHSSTIKVLQLVGVVNILIFRFLFGFCIKAD